MREAGLQRFLWSSTPNAAVTPTKPPLPGGSFSEQVLAVARETPPEARFGREKVFISDIYRRFGPGNNPSPLSQGEFKRQLIEANRKGELRLSRADLVEMMDPAKVAASETQFQNAIFHFVRL